jgi:hypothetical protein
MDTGKLIFPERKLAELILSKLAKRHPDADWMITNLPAGYQVAQKPKPSFAGFSEQMKPLKPVAPAKSVTTVTLSYCGQSPAFIECNVNGKKTWFGKSALVTYEVDDTSKTVVMTMATAYAKKRGLT